MQVSVPQFDRVRVLVAGDVMLDRYWFGPTQRISPEAPVPVVHVRDTEERPGGAGNVAVNLASLGVHCTVLGITGDDAIADSLAAAMQKRGVQCNFLRDKKSATITKLRVLSRHQQLIRLDFEESFSSFEGAPLLSLFKPALKDTDIVILSDYGKGSLAAVQELITAAKAAGKRVLVDPKGRDFSKYKGASLITPNLGELEAVVGECPDEKTIITKGEKLRDELGLEALLVTRSEHGMTLLQRGKAPLHLPTQAQEVSDVTGAGDTVIATLAAALGAGLDYPEASALSNLAAGVVVAKLGAATVSPAELRLAAHSRSGSGAMDEAAVLDAVAHARSQGERVIMTNGVFDILHAGHVTYLEQAKRLGDRLVVAVNDDASVKRLKGAARPVNTLANRMTVLAALSCVDWVVPFSEDTPERLICKVLPDVLVKGGDYKAEDVAGYKCVTKNGGEVKILPFVDGLSTTKTIEALKKKLSSAMRFFYTLALLLLAPFAFVWFAWRGWRQTGSADKLGERLGSSPFLPQGVAIWVHGASVGEIRAAAPLVQTLHRKYPERPILVTTFSATGRRHARQLFGDKVMVSLMPYDLPFFVNRFLETTKPAVGVIMETEIWPNLYAGCAKRNIPLLLVSARMSERAFNRYSDWKFRGLIRGALQRVQQVAAQTEADAARFQSLGADTARLSIMGNLKFDVQAGDDLLAAGQALRQKSFGKAGVVVAGSTREGEEPILLEAFRKLLQSQPNTVLVLAPRHPERANAVAAAISTAGFGFRRLSGGDATLKPGEVLLVDVLGQLMKFYAAGDLAFVGGTLVPVGGHNLLEPAAVGLPVLAGPHLENVKDVAEMLKDAGVLTPVTDADSLAAAAAWLLSNSSTRHSIGEMARGKVMQNRGALDKAVELVKGTLIRK